MSENTTPEFDLSQWDAEFDMTPIPAKLVLAWGMKRRAYDLAHPHGTHEMMGSDGVEYSTRPAFLDDLLPPLPPPIDWSALPQRTPPAPRRLWLARLFR